jgi:hypothetical protein
LTTSWSGGSTRTKQSIGRLIQRQMWTVVQSSGNGKPNR